MLFTRQLATMMRANVGIVPALEILKDQENPYFGEVIQALLQTILKGRRFSEATRLFPQVFHNSYVTMLEVSESNGRLDECLERLADWLERDLRLYRRIKGALTYPLFIVALTSVLTMLLVLTVMPGFVLIFEQMNIPLPLITRLLMGFTRLALHPGFWLVAVGSGWSLVRWLRSRSRDPVWSARVASLVCRLPILGEALGVAGMVRFCYAMEALLTGGASLVKALPLSIDCSGDPRLVLETDEALDEIKNGKSLQRVLSLRPLIFPRCLIGLVAVGEETGQISEMFQRTAALLADELEWRTDALSAALEPILIGSVSMVVGGVVMAIFLPLYGFIGNIGT